MKKATLVFVGSILFVLLLLGHSHAQLRPGEVTTQMLPGNVMEVSSGRTLQENLLSIGVLVFGLLFAGIVTIATVKCKTERLFGVSWLKLVGLTLVITAGLFLICAGYTENQIAPMIGLLGTVAGYLLGKGDPKEKAG